MKRPLSRVKSLPSPEYVHRLRQAPQPTSTSITQITTTLNRIATCDNIQEPLDSVELRDTRNANQVRAASPVYSLVASLHQTEDEEFTMTRSRSVHNRRVFDKSKFFSMLRGKKQFERQEPDLLTLEISNQRDLVETNDVSRTKFSQWLLELAEKLPDGLRKKELNQEAVDILLSMPNSETADTFYLIAHCYFGGIVVKKDQLKAYHYFKKACSRFHPGAIYYRAKCCEFGNGRRISINKAIDFYKLAAGSGITAANLRLGAMYMNGQLKQKKNVELALKHLTLAALDLHKPSHVPNSKFVNVFALHASLLLGLHYISINEYLKAYNLFFESAKNGYEPSMFLLGLCYRDGLGVKTDLKHAGLWFQRTKQIQSMSQVIDLPLPQ